LCRPRVKETGEFLSKKEDLSMSSFATAASRTPDQEPPNGNPLSFLATPDAAPEIEIPPRMDAPRSEVSGSGTPQNIGEIDRVERLLNNLEARSMALVPYGYGNLREVSTRKTNTAVIAGVIVAIWFSSVVLAIAYMRYVGRSPFATDRASSAAPLVIAPEPEPQEQKVAASVDHLARALASSSERMNELQAAVEKSNRDLQKLTTKNNAPAPLPPSSAQGETFPSSSSTVVVETNNLPKNWHKVLDIKPTESAVAHRGSDGAVDYWLVPRGTEAAASKVLPIGNSADGVVVHNLEDGKDYVITPSGEWRNGSLAPSGN
jgi:hypothetical protein